MPGFLKHLRRSYLIAALVIVAIVAVELGLHFSSGGQSDQVTLSQTQGDASSQVAKGDLSDMLAKATEMTAFNIQLPAELPPGGRVVAITVSTATPHTPGQSIALLDIEASSRHYLLQEFDGAYPGRESVKTIGGGTAREPWGAALDISRPGVQVYAIPSFRGTKDEPNQGYALIGDDRSYIILTTTPTADAQAEAALHTMLMSLPMK